MPRATAYSLAALCLALLLPPFTRSTELTFQVPPFGVQCFHEEVEAGAPFLVEFQVISGGNRDIDVFFRDPAEQELHKELRREYSMHELTAARSGDHSVCFSNAFSATTAKVVWADVRTVRADEEDERPPGAGADWRETATALTEIETKLMTLHHQLRLAHDAQTHLRLHESTHRKVADEMNLRVNINSIVEMVLLVLISVGEVLWLRSLFSEPALIRRDLCYFLVFAAVLVLIPVIVVVDNALAAEDDDNFGLWWRLKQMVVG